MGKLLSQMWAGLLVRDGLAQRLSALLSILCGGGHMPLGIKTSSSSGPWAPEAPPSEPFGPGITEL
jgi:hypothetical protein